jgi:hypothetical protein
MGNESREEGMAAAVPISVLTEEASTSYGRGTRCGVGGECEASGEEDGVLTEGRLAAAADLDLQLQPWPAAPCEPTASRPA